MKDEFLKKQLEFDEWGSQTIAINCYTYKVGGTFDFQQLERGKNGIDHVG